MSPRISLKPDTLLIALAMGLFVWLSYSYWGFFQDDAYVILRYAEKWLAGDGLVFNPGERVEGYTEPLWTFVMALMLALGLPGIATMKILSMGFGAGAIWHLGRAAQMHIRDARVNAVPSLLLAVTPSYVLWSQGGLGTMLFVYAVFANLHALLRYLQAPSRARFFLYFFTMALALLSRPEAVFYGVASGLVLLFANLRAGRNRDTVWFAFLCAAVLVGWYGFRVAYYGELYPNTYFAKVSSNVAQWKHGMLQFKNGVLLADYNYLLLAAWPVLLLRKRSILALSLMAGLLIHTIYYIRIGTDLLPMHRLYQPAYGLFYFLLADALAEIRRAVLWLALALCAAYGANLWHSTHILAPYAGMYSATEAASGDIGRWLEEHANAGDKVAVTDVGAIAYYAKKLYVLDLLGLTDYTAAHALHDNGYYPWIDYLAYNQPGYTQKREKYYAEIREYVVRQNPRYMVIQINVKPENYELMQGYVAQPPEVMNQFLIDAIAQPIARVALAGDPYRIVLVRAYDPYNTYFLLLERP